MGRWLVVLSLLGALAGSAAADALALPIPARKPGAPNVPELEAYVFVADPYRAGFTPRRLDPAKVGAYLAVMIDKTSPLRAVEYAETAAVFYDASEVVAPYLALLDKQEKTADDRRRSIVFARIVAELGTDKEVAAATSYFGDLCGRADNYVELGELVRLFAVLPATADIKPLNDRIRARSASIASKTVSDYQAELESHTLADQLNELERVKVAKEVRAKVLAITDRPARLRALIAWYLGTEATSWDLRPWAAARLRRETWAEQPAEHMTRVARPAHTKTVARAMRESLALVAKQGADEQRFLKTRALRAIAFFGGALTAGEKKFLAGQRSWQADTLSNEGFMLTEKKR